jgi:hypothetical protein
MPANAGVGTCPPNAAFVLDSRFAGAIRCFQPGRHSFSVIEMDAIFLNLCRSAWGWFVEISSEIVRR